MTIREINVDDSVKYIHCANSSPGENSHDHKLKIAPIPQKKTKIFTKQKKIKKITLKKVDLKESNDEQRIAIFV